MKRRRFLTIVLTAAMLVGGTAIADDGEMTNKNMTGHGNIKLPDFGQEIFDDTIPEAEHSFTSMMKFYVPSQAASGVVGPITYNNIDVDEIGENLYEEELSVAKPLVNVFIYGPIFHVEDTAFGHSFMDTYAAVSLDDGETWKKTNLSDSASESSFIISEDHVPGSGKLHKHDMPDDHTIPLKDGDDEALHPKRSRIPYKAGCDDCHGETLLGGTKAQSCYNCHDERVWREVGYIADEPTIKKAEWDDRRGGTLIARGTDAPPRTLVEVINPVTDELLGSDMSSRSGKWRVNIKRLGTAPCSVAAIVNDAEGPYIVPDGTPAEDCIGPTPPELELNDYPGGSYNVFHATVGNKTLVAWPSRFCDQGQPAYSFAYDGNDDPDEDEDSTKHDEHLDKRNAVATYLGVDVTKDLYLTDLFGVAGAQGSIDFAGEGYPQAGVVPFGCVWTARGVLLPGDDTRTAEPEDSHMVWTKPERLTSGRRDPNRIEVKGVEGAGFVITWQEDPDGLRPGDGMGPGEGWSGAVAHAKTDIWYSFIPWKEFDLVEGPEIDPDYELAQLPINIADHILPDAEDDTVEGSGRPQVYVPMAVPMRLTNNDKCNPAYHPDYEDENGVTGGIIDPTDKKYFSYCNYLAAESYGLQDFCQDIVLIPQGKKDADGTQTEGYICVNEDGLPNIANTGSTRPRLSLQGYASQEGGIIDRAWVILAAEESKGLGRSSFVYDLEGGYEACDPEADDADPGCGSDIGKNQWYFSFDMGDPATSEKIGMPYGLVQNLVKQGNLLNQPEVNWQTGEFYPVINTSLIWDFVNDVGDAEYNYDLYNTEIARRSSLLVQSIGKAVDSSSGLLAMPSWKQGVMRQGGPADTMLRRIVLEEPGSHTQGIDNNPYAFTNMDCTHPNGESGWVIDANNPYYPDGICMAPATNLSSVIPDICKEKDPDTGNLEDAVCPTVKDFSTSAYGIGTLNPILQDKDLVDGGNKTWVLTWHQCPSGGEAQNPNGIDDTFASEGGLVTCATDTRDDQFVNLRDQSWYNPLDVSKGHRGFLDGDFVMFLYAWSPNWKLNAKGHDRYDLYVRRSFTGGDDWTTTPSDTTIVEGESPLLASDGYSFGGDGTVTCETYRSPEVGTSDDRVEPRVCFNFDPGVAEHARNITQHKAMRLTTLDPRYASTPGSITENCLEGLLEYIDPANPETVITLTSEWSCSDGYGTGVEGDSDVRDPSRFFMIYETGDNTTVQVGEAEPLDLFYARAEGFGDDYVVWTETDSLADSVSGTPNPLECFPSHPHEVFEAPDVRIDSGFCNEFDRMTTGSDTFASEASVVANPDGSKLYGTWTQVKLTTDDFDEESFESDAMARRIWWIDNYISDTEAYTLQGLSGGSD